MVLSHWRLNTLRSRQDGRHFPDDIFRCIFLNENEIYSIKNNNGLAPNRRQAIHWTNDDPVQRRIYVSFGLNELSTATRKLLLERAILVLAVEWWVTCISDAVMQLDLALVWYYKQYRRSTGLEWCKYQCLSPNHVDDCQQMNITFDISTWPGPPFGNRFWNTSWAVGLTYWIVYLHFFCILTYAIIYVLIHHIIFGFIFTS